MGWSEIVGLFRSGGDLAEEGQSAAKEAPPGCGLIDLVGGGGRKSTATDGDHDLGMPGESAAKVAIKESDVGLNEAQHAAGNDSQIAAQRDQNIVERGFQIPSSVQHGPLGPSFRNLLVADTEEGSAGSGLRPASELGFPSDSYITAEGNRKTARYVLHLDDGTEVSSGRGGWRAQTPDGVTMRSYYGDTVLGQRDKTGQLTEYEVTRNNQLLFPKNEQDAALRNTHLQQMLDLQRRYPNISSQ